MADLIGIGVSGLSAYQRALATTSNNIANLQTEGYVRQRAVLASAGQDPSAVISVGTGVRFAEVQRLYDRFAEENLQRATSGLEAEQGMLKELQALQDAIGSSEAGLHGAFQDFFDSARELEASPASAGARAGFLAKSEGLAARFRSLAATAASLDDGTRAQIDQAVAETNTLLSQIASLNTQLLKRSSASEQPMQLLDQRDNAIREISKKLGVTVVIGPSGAANIYAGESASGAALVENGRARAMSAAFDTYDYGKSEFVLDAASQPVVLPSIKSGLIGGLIGFRREGLGAAVDKLDELALSFGRAVNKLHRDGIDSAGRPGEDLFYVGPKFVIDGKANGGSARIGVSVVDPEVVKPASYEMRFNAAAGLWQVRNQLTGISATGATSVTLDGLKFTVEGTARDSDTFRISPENHPAATLATLIKDGSQVASAGKLAVRASSTNMGATAAEMSLTPPREATEVRSLADLLPRPKTPVGEQTFTPDASVTPYQDTVVTARTGPIAVIPAGYSKIALSTAIGEGSELAVFTRDGRQLSGPAMNSNIVDAKYGFFAGATYSAAYLNKVDDPATKDVSESYLGYTFGRGAYAEGGRQVDVDGRVILTPARLYGTTGPLNSASENFNLLVNGKTVAISSGASPSAIVTAINNQKSSTGMIARFDPGADGDADTDADNSIVLSTYNEVTFNKSAIDVDADSRVSLTVNGAEYSVGTHLKITTGDLAASNNYITLNSTEYQFDDLSDLESQLTASGFDVDLTGGELTVRVANDSMLKIGANSLGLAEREDYFLAAPTSANVASKLAEMVNDAGTTVKATFDATTGKFVLTNADLKEGEPIIIGGNSVGLTEKTYFNDAAISLDLEAGVPRSVLGSLGFRSGFVMNDAAAEDLLVFGVDKEGDSTGLSLSGTYQVGNPPANGLPDKRAYTIRFESGNYSLIDSTTQTIVAQQKFDTTARTVRYGNWTVTLKSIPSDGDSFTITPNDDASGDNRVISLIANLQFNREILPSGQTVQQEYEDLVNKIGVLTVQAEVGRDAQKVVFDQARENRDRVSGVNLDEELSDLLRYQQAYQANAQVIQTASRLFETLMQRL